MLNQYINTTDPFKVYIPKMNSVATKLTYQAIKQAIQYILDNYNKGSIQGYLNTFLSHLPNEHPLNSPDGLSFKELLIEIKEVITGTKDYAQNTDKQTYVACFFFTELIQNFYGTQTLDNTGIAPYVYENMWENSLNVNRFGGSYRAELIEDFFLLATIFSARVFVKEHHKAWNKDIDVQGIGEYNALKAIYNMAKKDDLIKEYSKIIVGLLGQKYAMHMVMENRTAEAEELSNDIIRFGETIYGIVDFDKLNEVDIDQMSKWADDLALNMNIMNASSDSNEGKRNAILNDQPLNGIKYIVPEAQYADYILDENEEPHSADDIAVVGHEDILDSHSKYLRTTDPVKNVQYLIDKNTGERYFPDDFASTDHNHDRQGYARIEDLADIDAEFLLGEKVEEAELKGILEQLTNTKEQSSVEYVEGIPYLSDKVEGSFFRLYTTDDFAEIGHNHDSVLMQETDIPIGAKKFYDNISGGTYGMDDFALKGHKSHYDEDGNEIHYLSKEDRAVASYRLGGKEIDEFALEGHDHDERYYKKEEMVETFRDKRNVAEEDKYVSGLNIYHDNGNKDSMVPTQIRIGTKTLGPGESYLLPYDNIDFVHITVVGDIEGGGLPIQGDDEEVYYDENGIERKRRRIKVTNPTGAYLSYNYLITFKM